MLLWNDQYHVKNKIWRDIWSGQVTALLACGWIIMVIGVVRTFRIFYCLSMKTRFSIYWSFLSQYSNTVRKQSLALYSFFLVMIMLATMISRACFSILSCRLMHTNPLDALSAFIDHLFQVPLKPSFFILTKLSSTHYLLGMLRP
jgi:hypothetical protein